MTTRNCLTALISCAQACHVQARSRPCAHTRARLYIQCLHSPHLLRARTRVLPHPLCKRAARHREPISANNLPPRRALQVRVTVCNDARNVLRSCPQNGDMFWCPILRGACDARNCLNAHISCARACHVQARSGSYAQTHARLHAQYDQCARQVRTFERTYTMH